MESRKPKTLAWLLLIAYAWTSAFWAEGLVLCFEADGHVTIEAESSACSDCCPESEGERSPSIGACACLDVALGMGDVTAAKKSPVSESQRTALAAFVKLRWAANDQPVPAFLRALPRSHASSALTFLSSVVLRV